MNRLLKYTLALHGLNLLFVILPFKSSAVDIHPLRLEYTLKAGKVYSGEFELSNPSQSTVVVSVSAGEYRYLFGTQTKPIKQTDKLPKLPSCKGWFNFNKKEYLLNPGEIARVKFTISVPKQAKKEHLCAIIFDEKKPSSSQRAKKEGHITVNIIPRFSIPVYLMIDGYSKPLAKLENLDVVSEPVKNGVRFNLTIQNLGNVHLRPFGTLVVLNEDKQLIKNIPIGETLPLFPEYKDVIPILCPQLPAGVYTAIATIEYAEGSLIQKEITFQLNTNGTITYL